MIRNSVSDMIYMVANRRHISENNKHMSIMRNQLRIITINDIWIGGGGGGLENSRR